MRRLHRMPVGLRRKTKHLPDGELRVITLNRQRLLGAVMPL